MRHATPALFLVAAATLGFPRTAVSARPATFVRGALPGLGDVLREAALKLELVRALGADARHVTVSVSGDRAFLGGVVEERATQEPAEEFALSADGIRDVENRIVEGNRPGAPSSIASQFGDASRLAVERVRDVPGVRKVVDLLRA